MERWRRRIERNGKNWKCVWGVCKLIRLG